jgi:membrane protease YdiL (CAAX protease family)
MSAATNERPPLVEDVNLALLYGALGAIAVLLLFPYLLATMPQAFAKLPVSLPVVALAQAAQGFVLLGLLALAGLRMGHSVGLGSPWLRALRFGRPRPAQAWLRAVALGLAAGTCIVALSPLFDASMPVPIHPLPTGSPASASWAGFLASFYGGIAEEVELRLFLMTLIVWAVAKLSRRAPGPALLWMAVLVAALLFGAGHLPAAAKIWPLDTVVILRTIALNGIGGMVFGWLYWRQGLESAMLGHFCADLVLHVATPLVAGAMG